MAGASSAPDGVASLGALEPTEVPSPGGPVSCQMLLVILRLMKGKQPWERHSFSCLAMLMSRQPWPSAATGVMLRLVLAVG